MAKTFYTNGTGSQQTLTGSQDEKVAVYQTLADAEADLANLEAGQIVATPDTGDENAQPVDVVESGNMHAVTSNAVANSNAMPVNSVISGNMHSVTSDGVSKAISYSITEQLTGGKWIDGKPIYKVTVDCGALPNNTDKAIVNALSNVDTVIKLTGMASDGTAQITIPYSGSAKVITYVYNNDVHIATSDNLNTYSKSYVIIEYTKTTD